MARPLRIELADAYYHAMNRGNNRQDIFFSDKDRLSFLEALADSCEIFAVRLVSYALMSNHFHLLIHTAQANLSEFMRHFQVTYTVRFNRRNGRSGHVFQGRFKSLLVEADEYLLPLSRYIHLNPIRRRRFKTADVCTQTEYLKNYPWSSFAGYGYIRKRVPHFDYSWLLTTYFGQDNAQGRRQYRNYVYHGVGGEIENPFKKVVQQSILGSQDFVDWVKKKLPRTEAREIPALRNLQPYLSVDRIIEAVARAGGVETSDVIHRKTPAKFLRQVAMELCYRRSNYSQKEIGDIFGVDYSTVSQNRARLKSKLKSSRKLKHQFNQIQDRILNLSK
jgi:putative transposase